MIDGEDKLKHCSISSHLQLFRVTIFEHFPRKICVEKKVDELLLVSDACICYIAVSCNLIWEAKIFGVALK